jgi:UDP-GlcNAc:undecaprenyl-phosphate/decaprenyl-phosphate GlcNAc-1-phosphate transferase
VFLIFTLGVLSVVLALIITPCVRDLLGKSFLDHPDGVRKKHAAPVPRVGGIAIAISYVVTFAIALILPFTYAQHLHHELPGILPLTLAASVIFFTGVLDDLIGLAPWQKLLGIVGAAVLAYFSGIHVHIQRLQYMPAWVGFAITVIWLVGCTNAFNLIDGMDGLAAGIGLVATVTMLLAALVQNNVPLILATIPLAGCLLGFLRYNFNGASVYLGDSGSLSLGFLLGCFGALWSNKSVTLMALTVPLLAVSIPLLDVVLSILRRFLRNRPIFQADRGHIHHRLLARGLSQRRAVLTMYAFCGLVAVLSLLVTAIHNNQFGGLIVILFGGAVWLGISQLDYAEFASAGRILFGQVRRMIDVEARLKDFEANLAKASNVEECWSHIRAGSRDFGFHEVRMNFNGCVFDENHTDPTPAQPRWQLRIPLRDSQYVNFYRGFDSAMDPLVISAFVQAVQRGLEAQPARPAVEVIRMSGRGLFYAAGASGADRRRASR